MTVYEQIKKMSIDDMALMLHIIIRATEEKFEKKLIEANIPFEKIELTDEIQIARHKKYLESEVDQE